MEWLNWPNRITIARIVLVAPLVICLLNLNVGWTGWRGVALTLVLAMGLSDALDGFLARRLKAETPLGKFLDPVADKLLITCAVVLLAIETTAVPGFKLPSWVPVFALGKDLLIVIGFAIVYLTTGEFCLKPRIWGKLCTTVQLIMIASALIAPNLPAAFQEVWPVTYWLASALAIAAVVDYIKVGTLMTGNNQASATK